MSKEKRKDYRKQLNNTIKVIGENFFIDPEKRAVGNHTVKHWNTTLLALSYALDQNPLIMGEPGFAKTTAAKVVSAVMSGYPFDLYEAAQIQGHPDQTYETMIARLDFSKLSREEKVIWLISAYLPVRIVDEINRLPTGNQDELLNALQTGRFNYLNSTFFTGKTPFFATANHPDDGNHVLIPPLRDRFSIHLELGHIGASYRADIKSAKENIRELCNDELTTGIIAIVNDPGKSIEEKLRLVDEARKGYVDFLGSENIGVTPFEANDRTAIQNEVESVELSRDADLLLNMIDSELNYTPTFGRKRSNDKVDTSNHAKELASTCVYNAGSPRAMIDGIESYAKALAYLSGDSEVTKEHVMAVAPHALGHRLEFTEDFRSQHEGKKREGTYGETMEMHLARELTREISERYGNTKAALEILGAELNQTSTLTPEIRKKADAMLKDEAMLDHPLLKEYARRITEARERT